MLKKFFTVFPVEYEGTTYTRINAVVVLKHQCWKHSVFLPELKQISIESIGALLW